MIFGVVILVVAGILFLIIYNIANARRSSQAGKQPASASDAQGGGARLRAGSGPAAETGGTEGLGRAGGTGRAGEAGEKGEAGGVGGEGVAAGADEAVRAVASRGPSSPAEEALERPEAVVRAEPGLNPDSFDPASLENAAAAGAIHLDEPTAATAAEDLKAARRGSLDAQYRDALRRFAAEENGGLPESRRDRQDEAAPGKSADEAYRDALRALGRKE
ncbi:hypothetical protein [Paenibacillus pinistramenti]|uniref:hypothetical protein n=1 Tax=Paenibacillus pinistramenti TaxID=1768003 RepID=UPI001396A95C|nr:hypothetical protein [Paenibacillus pinistramenti]